MGVCGMVFGVTESIFDLIFGLFPGILEESPTDEDNSATIKAKYFYQSCMNMSEYFNISIYEFFQGQTLLFSPNWRG